MAERIKAFDRACRRSEYTDTETAWEILRDARRVLQSISKSTDCTGAPEMTTAPYVTVAAACAAVNARHPELAAHICPETLGYLFRDVQGPELVSIAYDCGVSTIEMVRCIGVVRTDCRTAFAPGSSCKNTSRAGALMRRALVAIYPGNMPVPVLAEHLRAVGAEVVSENTENVHVTLDLSPDGWGLWTR